MRDECLARASRSQLRLSRDPLLAHGHGTKESAVIYYWLISGALLVIAFLALTEADDGE
jgi:hypothetical protein